jgi:hypothetical protein
VSRSQLRLDALTRLVVRSRDICTRYSTRGAISFCRRRLAALRLLDGLAEPPDPEIKHARLKALDLVQAVLEGCEVSRYGTEFMDLLRHISSFRENESASIAEHSRDLLLAIADREARGKMEPRRSRPFRSMDVDDGLCAFSAVCHKGPPQRYSALACCCSADPMQESIP